MTVARRLVPGQTHMTTRRTARRCGFLQPTKAVNEIVGYALGLALMKHDVGLHAATVEPTHPHVALTDTQDRSRLPAFFRDFHCLVARALNAHYGRGENLWRAGGSYDNVEVSDRATLEEQLLYVWTQCVKDGLVPTPEAWPGVTFLPEDFGRTFTFHRPEAAFFGGRRPDDWEPTYAPARRALRAAERREREARRRRDEVRARRKARRKGRPVRPGARPPKERAPRPERRDRRKLPALVTFTLEPPPGYEHLTIEQVRAHFRALLDERLAVIQAERARQGLRYMGVQAILAQSPLDSVGDTFPSFGRNPRVACLQKERRLALLEGLQAWRKAYREALLAWRRGDRRVRFPWGSYALPHQHGARLGPSTGPPRML